MSEAGERERQEIERMMRRAEASGEDPQRVATALGYAAREPMERQSVARVKRQSWLRLFVAVRSRARSRSGE